MIPIIETRDLEAIWKLWAEKGHHTRSAGCLFKFPVPGWCLRAGSFTASLWGPRPSAWSPAAATVPSASRSASRGGWRTAENSWRCWVGRQET